VGKYFKKLGINIKKKITIYKLNLFLIFTIILLLSIVLTLFLGYREQTNNTEQSLPPPKSNASITITEFNHTATKNGIKQWTLKADSASLYAEEDIANLTGIDVVFYLKKKTEILLNADNANLNLKTNNMEVKGNITAKLPEYTLETENLQYLHESHIIMSNKPVEFIGSTMSLRADRMSYSLQTGMIACDGNIRGTFDDTIEK